MKIFIYIPLLVSFSGICFAQKPKLDSLVIGKDSRTFRVKIPASAPDKDRALLIALHGGGADGASMEWSMKAPSETYGFVQFYPNGVGKTWNLDGVPTGGAFVPTVDDIAFVKALIDKGIQKYKVNPSKIFLIGASRGGMLALYAMTKMPGKITAVSAIISSLPKRHENFSLNDKVGLLMINGTQDPLISYTGGVSIKPTDRPKTIETKKGQELVATEALIQKMIVENDAARNPVKTTFPNKDPKDGCTAEAFTYVNKNPLGLVKLIKVNGGGHVVPGGNQYLPKSVIGNACKDFSGYIESYEFFKTFLQ